MKIPIRMSTEPKWNLLPRKSLYPLLPPSFQKEEMHRPRTRNQLYSITPHTSVLAGLDQCDEDCLGKFSRLK